MHSTEKFSVSRDERRFLLYNDIFLRNDRKSIRAISLYFTQYFLSMLFSFAKIIYNKVGMKRRG
jgi:hypothetical protein